MKLDLPIKVKEPDSFSSLWRYMDVQKFISLISSSSLYFTKCSELSERYDRYEGTYPFFMKHNMSLSLQKLSEKCWNYAPEEVKRRYDHDKSKLLTFWGELCYINCWHENKDESDAMWKVYAAAGKGIAIRTRYHKMLSSLYEIEDPYLIGNVDYRNYDIEYIPDDNLYYPILSKQVYYKHENEVRIIMFKYDKDNSSGEILIPLKSKGISIPLNLNTLIETVILAPNTPDYFLQAINNIIEKYKYEFRARPSRINEEPM